MLPATGQPNEPARCATLLPVLALLPQPLALIEVGASAGLCLLPDQYGYEYGATELRPAVQGGGYPVFACAASAATPLPAAVPQIVWRAGLDLNPLDAADLAECAWLETLVWPEQTARLARLRAALALAAVHRPRIERGDLLGDGLARLCREAPQGATLVVFHTAVLAYVADPAERQMFADQVAGLGAVWIANESPRVFPGMAELAPAGPAGHFLMAVNGVPVAWTDPHGAAIDWIGGPDWLETAVR